MAQPRDEHGATVGVCGFVGNERLTDEGKAQQRKAGEQLDALRKQAKAQAKEAKAEVAEQRQRAAQHVKEEKEERQSA